ncbi:hypothetical protein FB555_000118 [Alpinimonas psychrophila]|uniref:Uncharacterized protein n=1 Tax=Alpinimonas psychrophila TaxID=748908 RepID=A0A7W3PN37_9MICO|nr:hypothetical protein [Alpinimonas psychrophila]
MTALAAPLASALLAVPALLHHTDLNEGFTRYDHDSYTRN